MYKHIVTSAFEVAARKNVERLTTWLREQPEVIHVGTLSDIFKRINRSMHGDDPEWYRLPEERDMAAQYLLLYEMSLPYGLDLNNQIDIEKRSTRPSVYLETLSTTGLLGFERRVDEWMAGNTPEIRATGASPPMMFSYIGFRNALGMLVGTALRFRNCSPGSPSRSCPASPCTRRPPGRSRGRSRPRNAGTSCPRAGA